MTRCLFLAATLALLACSESDGGPRGASPGGQAGAAGAQGGSGGSGGSGGQTGMPCATEDDCFGTTAHCDTTRGVCTGCATDDDCRGGLLCDMDTGICRDCVTNDDCFPSAPICDAVSGQCTANCATFAECSTTGGPSVCDTTRGVCVDCVASIGSCFCELVTYSCVGCLLDADCPATAPYCGPGHECSPACASDADCPAGLHCDAASERCVECAKNAHCEGEVCQPDYTCG